MDWDFQDWQGLSHRRSAPRTQDPSHETPTHQPYLMHELMPRNWDRARLARKSAAGGVNMYDEDRGPRLCEHASGVGVGRGARGLSD